MAGSVITGSYVEHEIEVNDFNNEIDFSVEKIYWVVFERDGAPDENNYFSIKVCTDDINNLIMNF